MPGMWPPSRVPSIEDTFRCTILHSSPFNPHTRFYFSSIRLGGPRGRIDSILTLAEHQRRLPHDQAEPGFELTTFSLER